MIRFIAAVAFALSASFAPAVRTPGDPIPDIDVVVEQIPAGKTLTTHTDANGAFAFSLAPGNYTLRIGSRPAPHGAATRRAENPPFARNGRLVKLPDNVTAKGGWPYALRLVDGDYNTQRIANAEPSAAQRSNNPGVADLEVRFSIGVPAVRGAGPTVFRGGVEERE